MYSEPFNKSCYPAHLVLTSSVRTVCLHACRWQCWPITAITTPATVATTTNKYINSSGTTQLQPLPNSNGNTGNCQNNGSSAANPHQQQQQQQQYVPPRLQRTSTFRQLSSRWNTWRQAMDRRSAVIGVAARTGSCDDDSNRCSSAGIATPQQQQQQLLSHGVSSGSRARGTIAESPPLYEVCINYLSVSASFLCVCCCADKLRPMYAQHRLSDAVHSDDRKH
jgi:hypothetical protein